MSARAVRNNNALNIETGDPWQGLMPRNQMTVEQANEQRFCVFLSPRWGFRAAARLLIKYKDKYQADTLKEIISRWAPPSENPTDDYIAFVSALTGFTPDEKIDVYQYAVAFPLIKAMAQRECGGWYFDESELREGLRLAGIEPPKPSVAQSPTMKAVSTAGLGSISIGAVAEAAQQLSPAVSTISHAAQNWQTAVILILVLALGAVAYFHWKDNRA